MRLIRLLGLGLLLGLTAFGQRVTFRGGFGGRGGFGHGGFRAFPSRQLFRSRAFLGYRSFYRPPIVYPWYFPYFGFGYGGGYSYEYAPEPNVTVIYLPSPAPPPPVEAPAPVRPQVKEYGPTSRRAPIYFSIARTDGTVTNAAAFWVEDNTLHYFDLDGRREDVPLKDIDRDRSERLNGERGLEFRLPAPR